MTTPRQRYLRNLSLIEPFNYASQKGILYDQQAAEAIRQQETPLRHAAQAKIDAAAGRGVLYQADQWLVRTPAGPVALLDYVQATCCIQRHIKKGLVHDLHSAVAYSKKSRVGPLGRLRELVAAGLDTPAVRGEMGLILDCGLNAQSNKQVANYLTSQGLRLPPKQKDNPDAPDALTADAAALLERYIQLCGRNAARAFTPATVKAAKASGQPLPTEQLRPLLLGLLEVRASRKRLQELDRGVDSDGRIRSSFIICGPKTDRTASHKWLTGGGGNAQTVPKEPVNFRVAYTSDPDYLWFKLDLTGADLWTVAARTTLEGDRTMLDDLLAGIRIPSLIGLMMFEGYKPTSDRKQVREDCKAYRAALKASGEKWRDTLCKKIGHMTNYGGLAKRVHQAVIEDTYAETGTPYDPGLELCARGQQLYLARYWGLPKWWRRVGDSIVRTGKLVFATGREHEFLGRRPAHGLLDQETRREALATEPQHNTCFVALEGMRQMWYDPANWPSGEIGVGEPRCQILIPNVHDECDWEARVEDFDWVAQSIPKWFDISLQFSPNLTITIPYSWGWGTNWGQAERHDRPDTNAAPPAP